MSTFRLTSVRWVRFDRGPMGRSHSSGSGVGCVLLLVFGVWAAATQSWGVFVFVVVAILVVRYLLRRARHSALAGRFGPVIADRILANEYWQGATWEMLIESIGKPADIRESVLKTKTKHTYCYQPIAKNRYALRVHLEDGVVVGWDDASKLD